MFGLGFTEMLLIIVIAILFLGPDKLPSAMVDVAKFFRNVKKTIGTVKDSFEEEMHVSDIKNEVLSYKKELLGASDNLKNSTGFSDIGAQLTNLHDDIMVDDAPAVKTNKKKQEPEQVTFEKKSKQENLSQSDVSSVKPENTDV
jgi:sec-independent protein translocase protein TatB